MVIISLQVTVIDSVGNLATINMQIFNFAHQMELTIQGLSSNQSRGFKDYVQ